MGYLFDPMKWCFGWLAWFRWQRSRRTCRCRKKSNITAMCGRSLPMPVSAATGSIRTSAKQTAGSTRGRARSPTTMACGRWCRARGGERDGEADSHGRPGRTHAAAGRGRRLSAGEKSFCSSGSYREGSTRTTGPTSRRSRRPCPTSHAMGSLEMPSINLFSLGCSRKGSRLPRGGPGHLDPTVVV